MNSWWLIIPIITTLFLLANWAAEEVQIGLTPLGHIYNVVWFILIWATFIAGTQA